MTSEPTTAAGRQFVEDWAPIDAMATDETRVTDEEDRADLQARLVEIEVEARAIGAVEGTEGLRAMLRKNRDLTAYVIRHAESRDHDWSSACDGCNPDPEARAEADAQIAALREALSDIIYVGTAAQRHENWRYTAETITERAQDALADTAPAEPRWPSGPDAEQRLNAAADKAGRKHPDDAGFAADILAALQEKRDHAE